VRPEGLDKFKTSPHRVSNPRPTLLTTRLPRASTTPARLEPLLHKVIAVVRVSSEMCKRRRGLMMAAIRRAERERGGGDNEKRSWLRGQQLHLEETLKVQASLFSVTGPGQT
jgi:hypothetical protein